MACAALAQHVHHVLEVFDVAALIGRQRDGIGILLQGRAHHVLDAAVVAEVNHLRTLCLNKPAHDVDRRVVAVEQTGGGDEAQRATAFIKHRGLLRERSGGTHETGGIRRFLMKPMIGPRTRQVRLQRNVTWAAAMVQPVAAPPLHKHAPYPP